MFASRLSTTALTQLLLLVAIVELAVFRLAVKALAPPLETAPPTWHQVLNYLGLFLYYFASALALCVLAIEIVRHLRMRELYAAFARYALVVVVAGLLVFSITSTLFVPTARMGFLLEACFVSALLVLVVAQLTRRGDIGAKVGLVILCLPMVIHFYGPLREQLAEGQHWEALAVQLRETGKWTLVFAALVSPFCFAPRPVVPSAMRVGPLVLSGFVGLIAAIVLGRKYGVGMELAELGFGVDIGAGAPVSTIALYVTALAAVTWTLASCFTVHSLARQRIGVGVGLVFVGGYAFSWPLQYLVGMVGLIAIGDAAREAPTQELGRRSEYRAPPIAGETWQAYVAAIVKALRGLASAESASAVTVRGEDGISRTHIAATVDSRSMRITFEREQEALVALEVTIGDGHVGDKEPDWTLYARSKGGPSLVVHPQPPRTSASAVKTGDSEFDLRFQVRDRAEHTAELLNEGLRQRSVKLIDGWIAVWPGECLRYNVQPGRGAPLDHPVPITEMAFRGGLSSVSPIG